MLEQYIKEELIFLNWDVLDRDELFKKASDIFYQKELVDDQFYNFLCEREANYPTGLQLETHTVAIPHGNPERIKKPFISVITLESPIIMNKMEDSEEEIEVDLFFILGLNDGAQHLEILKQLIGLIQQESFIKEIKKTNSSKRLVDYIQRATK